MVTGSRTSGNPATGIDDRVRKTIQSIKEIVGNHSDADIYAALKEANMDADETAQRLLLQDPFHEVKRRRDRKKEDVVFSGPVSGKKPSGEVVREVKFRTQPEPNVRRGGYNRSSISRGAAPQNSFHRNSAAGTNREFRVVRDNRACLNVDGESRHSSVQSPVSKIDKVPANVNEKDASSTGGSGNRQPSGDQDSIHFSNALVNTRSRQAGSDASLHGPSRKELSKEKQTVQDATLPSSNSVVGVYSSSTDPIHVPSPDSRSSSIGAIRREVRGGDLAGKPSGNAVKDSSASTRSLSGSPLRKDGAPEAYRPFSPISKMDQLNPTAGRESGMPSGAANNRSLLSNQHSNRGNQYVRTQQQAGGHPKAVLNKEWKPKSKQKSGRNNPGVIGTPKKSSAAPADNAVNLESEVVNLQEKLSHVNIRESQNVIIAEHIRVPETDRHQVTFGSFVLEIDSSGNSASGAQEACLSEELECESAPSLPVAPPEASNDGAPSTKPVDVRDDQVRNSGSGSPVSTASEQQLPEQKEGSRTSQNFDEYAGIKLLSGNGPPYTSSESKQQQDTPELQNFSAYDPQTAYDLPYFRPSMDENIRGQGLPSPQEAFNTHTTSAPASTIPMLQQQAQIAQIYPQVHVSHFANLMPYRQFLPPVYVPQMPIQGYSGNPAAYAHPSNGSSYVLMPGGSSHLGANGIKYGIQQFKPVPTGGPTGFGSFNNPNVYPINSPGVVGNAAGLEDSSRMKYKDGNIYVPNPQAESSEIWMQNPRDLTGLQSPPYYNVPGQTPHGAYLSNHTAHPSFNAAAAQSSHMQFQGLFHPPQPGAMASPHHMGPGMASNIGVGVAPSPAAQVGTYQQPQVGHLNWPTNF